MTEKPGEKGPVEMFVDELVSPFGAIALLVSLAIGFGIATGVIQL